MNQLKLLNKIKTAIMLFLIFISPPATLCLALRAGPPVKAAVPLGVVFNEIAWMGNENSYNDEWIELYNNNSFQIDLSGWKIEAQDGSPMVVLSGHIEAFGFYLLERTDDTTVANVKADQIYNGALSNKGEYIKLSNKEENLIDEIDCSKGWFKGDNETKQSMERKAPDILGNNPENWQTSQSPNGTPKHKNSLGLTEADSQPTEDKAAETGPPQAIEYPLGVIFNEIMPSPLGADDKEEWVELYNKNNFKVDLSGWKISDSKGSTKIYNFPDGTEIPANGFLLLLRPETKITLNNDADTLKLTRPDNKVADSVNYKKAPRGKSYGLLDENWQWNTNPSPGKINESGETEYLQTEKPEEKIPEEVENKRQETDLSEKAKQKLAAKVLPNNGEGQFAKTIYIALTIALLSGMAALAVKKKLTH